MICIPSLFQGLDWELVATKKIEPPFKPAIKDDVDVSNFSTEFTNMAAADSPAVAAPDNMADVFRVITQY